MQRGARFRAVSFVIREPVLEDIEQLHIGDLGGGFELKSRFNKD